MKILILSSNNGSGHNSAGGAVAEQFQALGIPCEIRDAVSFRSRKLSAVIRWLHVNGAMHAPWLFKIGNSAAYRPRRGRSLCYRATSLLSRPISDYVRENHFDTVVCTHIFAALAVTHARRQNMLDVPAYFIPTDYDRVPYVEETALDGYFIPHPDLAAEYAAAGIPPERIHPTGIPVMARFARRIPQQEARRLLNLPLSGSIVLFMGGSMGFGKLKSMVRNALQRGPGNMSVVVLTGSNHELYDDLKRQYGFDRVIPAGYTDQVDMYMDAADVLLTKPGGLSTTEAAVKGVAMIHTDPIPGWETDNARFFQRLGLSRTGSSADEYIGEALDLLASPDARGEMIALQHRHINQNAARDICRVVVGEEETGGRGNGENA